MLEVFPTYIPTLPFQGQSLSEPDLMFRKITTFYYIVILSAKPFVKGIHKLKLHMKQKLLTYP